MIVEGQFYEPNTLKKILYAIHNKYNSKAKITAKDIDTYYISKYDSKRKGDKVIKGFTIIKKKII